VNLLNILAKQPLLGCIIGLSFLLFLCVLISMGMEETVIYRYTPTCMFKTYLNIECLSCGMTRSFLSIAKGNFGEANEFNKLGIPLFFVSAISFPLILIVYSFRLVSKFFKQQNAKF
jgi:hypothetical protein